MFQYDHILNCYRKFKSYIYYSKKQNYLYPDLADFENDNASFEKKISN